MFLLFLSFSFPLSLEYTSSQSCVPSVNPLCDAVTAYPGIRGLFRNAPKPLPLHSLCDDLQVCGKGRVYLASKSEDSHRSDNYWIPYLQDYLSIDQDLHYAYLAKKPSCWIQKVIGAFLGLLSDYRVSCCAYPRAVLHM